MTRALRGDETHPAPGEVGAYRLAPHRYRWDTPPDIDGNPRAMDLSAFKRLAPYQPGDVVCVVYKEGWRLAYVSHVLHEYDQYGDRRHKFRVHLADAKGARFQLSWIYAFPGEIQRGYARAGKAPDMPENYRK